MEGIIPISAPLLRSLDAETMPFYNVLDANRSAFEKGGMFYNFSPKRINTDVKLNDGGIISVTGGDLYGLQVSDTRRKDVQIRSIFLMECGITIFNVCQIEIQKARKITDV